MEFCNWVLVFSLPMALREVGSIVSSLGLGPLHKILSYFGPAFYFGWNDKAVLVEKMVFLPCVLTLPSLPRGLENQSKLRREAEPTSPGLITPHMALLLTNWSADIPFLAWWRASYGYSLINAFAAMIWTRQISLYCITDRSQLQCSFNYIDWHLKMLQNQHKIIEPNFVSFSKIS